MRRFAAILLSAATIAAAPAHAQSASITITTEEWIEEAPEPGAERLVAVQGVPAAQGEAYGPFRVLDERRAALVDATDAATPRAFQAMLRDHPGIAAIDMVECPGTDDDTANLALGRMIRAAGLATHVPAQGSVRSGAVELFLAGRTRTIDDGAEFAVHAWRDSDGRGPQDFAADSPVNRAYLDYYREMGVARPQAFYSMTNAVAYAGARWLTAQDMRGWLGETRGDGAAQPARPTIAYLDLAPAFP
jgi:hypothetical protein